MAINSSMTVSRRGLLGAFAAVTVAAAPTYSNAFGLLRGAGDIRRIKMYSGRTGESIDTIYWVEGEYIPEVLKEINHFMRDWRTDEVKKMDPRTVDIMAAAQHLKGQAADLRLKSRSVSQMARAAEACAAGGVGRYSRSDFVHMDCGPVRHWGG